MHIDVRRDNLRFFSFIGFSTLLIFIWIIYLFSIQVLDPHGFEEARRVRYTPLKQIQSPTRGIIRDRNSDLLVRTETYYQIDYDRSTLSSYKDNNKEQLATDYSKLASIISSNSSLSHQYVLSRLKRNSSVPSIYLSDRIRESDMVKIEREMLEHNYHRGLIINYSSQQRIYPKGNLAARLLGATSESKDSGVSSALSQLKGLCGIEATYDNELRGVYGWRNIFMDGRNRPVLIPRLGKQKVVNGNSLILTIDSRIQDIVEMNLKEGLKEYRAQNAVGIVMDPQSGEILALASVSAADENYASSEIRVMSNMATSFMFEPGSTIKSVTALVALENKLFNTTDMIDCRTYRTEHNRTIRDAHPFDDLSFTDVIAHSSNVGTVKIAEKVGAEALYDRLISLGFGNRTGSDLYGESAGLLRKLNNWQGFSLHSISFGQELAVTPLQLISAYAALANDGNLMRPYIVKNIVDENGKIVTKNTPKRIRKISSRYALDTVKEMLRIAVEEGTATGTRLPYISIAGKTGTAEKQLEGQAGYSRDKYVSNFVGFFPVEDPQYVILVLYDEPAYYYHFASMSAVPTFKKITEQILSLPDCNVVPQMRMQDLHFVNMPKLLGMKPHQIESVLRKEDINYQLLGELNNDEAVVIDQYPKPGIQFDTNQCVIVVLGKKVMIDSSPHIDEAQKEKMPSLINLTLRQAIREAKKYQINLEIEGKGVVITQSIPSGRTIETGITCKVSAR